ncbi:hypothetical protein DUZ99_06310 [Xylanibacillus composti]|uniref:Uncharacterized protein n=1 Tax=Xylanibacillus composti TaxID=1572762 RepID=A0A8J4H7X8_9BACL|nr:hypothetical protein [Xylanibacillus composti]MDT9724604.1 hypothetical protein [Xylanibacillus composti]GIQ70218.1 hypothetical protein XYCOK13_30420 [Xylanibacillus composti]
MKWAGKVKATVTEAGNKAKAVAEANRLRAETEAMREEMDRHFRQMGKLMFDARTGRMRELPEIHIRLCVDRILRLERDIEAAQNHMASIRKWSNP